MSRTKKTQQLTGTMYILAQNPGVSAREIAGHLKICERTAFRYLRELKELGYPLRPNRDPETDKVKYLLTPVSFTGPEALAMAYASQSLLNQKGLAINQHLKSALVKMESVIRCGEDTTTYQLLKPRFTYLSQEPRDYSPWRGIIDILNDCIKRNRSVKAVYDSFSSGIISERILDPYHVICSEGNLYLAAYCHLKKQMRNFRVDRFKSIEAQSKIFARNPAFNPTDYLNSSFKIWSGTEEIDIRFIVYPPTSRFFRESIYHHSQRLEELEDGKIICTFTVYDSPEIKSWLLSWGKQVEVIAPEGIKEWIREELQINLGRYV